MVPIPAQFLPHTVSARPLTGSNGMGDVYGAAFPVPCMVEESTRLVRDSAGAEVVSSAQVHCAFDYVVPAGSLVTVWVGTAREREAEVITAGGSMHPNLPSHQTLALK